MDKKPDSYKKTEKWWLFLIVLFYALYNLPGVPAYGNANGALLHGALTILPLWVISYGGMVILNQQRKLKHRETVDNESDHSAKEEM